MKIPAIGALRVGEWPWRRLLLFTLLGIASGALSGATVSLWVDEFGRVSLPVLSVAPGLVFGVAFSPLLVWSGWLPPARAAPWILAATLSNAAAVLCGLTVLALFQVLPPWLRFSEPAFGSIGLFAGAAGGGLLGFITAVVVPTMRARHCLLPVAAGAALGPLFVILTDKDLGAYVFYAIWQGGYAAALALALPEPSRREASRADDVPEHDYPHLDNLIAGWFHQDFDIAGNTLEAVIASFKKDTNSEDWANIRADIARLLQRYDDQALPEEFVRLFQPDVTVEGWDGMTTRQWLTRVDALLQ